ncbi:MAG: twin-arginine translocase subunit TatC, partial [Planctomycetes bacterium]|nr:twin-arginine translocase subunit TatC [Planctomycetota bacterium]
MAKSRKQPPEHPDEARMTIGEHLDELRGCLIRSLLAVFAACLICMYPARWIFQAIAAPAIIVLSLTCQNGSFLQTGPTEGVLVF